MNDGVVQAIQIEVTDGLDDDALAVQPLKAFRKFVKALDMDEVRANIAAEQEAAGEEQA